MESPIGIAAGPLLNSRWVQAYARLGYGLLTYQTVRSAARPAFPRPNLFFCRVGDPAVAEVRAPRRIDPGGVTWAVSLGIPSLPPDEWRADVARARGRLGDHQILIVSVAGTPQPGGDAEQLALDYALCARWAAEAGADVVELYLDCPSALGEHPPMVFENPALAGHIVDLVRRAVAGRPVIAKLGASQTPRALHDLATRLAPSLDGFVLVNGLKRRLVREDGRPTLPDTERETAEIVGAGVYDNCRVQVDELLAWRKAGAWSRVVLAVGGITTVERARAALGAGADAAMVGTAALTDPLIAARFSLSI
ncbi:MAG TPA: hypothetical protein VML54_03235 [Candidatus Limnocylindrales bacterium]|nr:hypothetical protein [Candidatus Limnocylindrales bacterium]